VTRRANLGSRSLRAALVQKRRSTAAATDLETAIPHTTTWRFDSGDAHSARDSRIALTHFIRRHAEPGADLFATELILGELLANTVEHAPGFVEVLIEWPDEQPTIRVRDAGPGFKLPRPSLPDDPYDESGRGLFLIQSLAPDVRIGPAPGFGTEISLTLPVSRTMDSRDFAAVRAA
jgi:anti-sigma regulatory factor (Ser/Thr protein kinase)